MLLKSIRLPLFLVIILLLICSDSIALSPLWNRNLPHDPPSMLILEVGQPTGTNISPLLGIDSGPLPYGDPGNADLTDEYKKIGVNEVRTHGFVNAFSMSEIYSDPSKDPKEPGSYNFTNTDKYAGGIINGSFGMYFRLGDSYEHVDPPYPDEEENWTKAAIEVIRHYYQGKWNGYHANLTYIEIWNEPDNEHFWPKPHTDEQFFQFYKRVTLALKQEFPELKVGGPGFTPAGCKNEKGIAYTTKFLNFMKKENVTLDFLSWHMYSNKPSDFRNGSLFYEDLLKRSGYNNTEIHLTEYNTEVKPGRQTKEGLALRAGIAGAIIMTNAWMALQDTPVARTFLFRGNDPTISFPTFYGIFYADGQRKSIADAFELWKKISEYNNRLEIKILNVNNNRDVISIAGKKSDGSIGILLTQSGEIPVSVRITGIGMGNKGIWNQSELSYNGIKTYKIPDVSLSLNPRTINLIEYSPNVN